jgi:DNA-binding cell septation regulator SpoVG
MNQTIAITELTWYPIRPTEKGLIGFAGLRYGNIVFAQSIAVYITPTGEYRLVFPERVMPNGKSSNICYPIDKQTYNAMLEAVTRKIEEVTRRIEAV